MVKLAKLKLFCLASDDDDNDGVSNGSIIAETNQSDLVLWDGVTAMTLVLRKLHYNNMCVVKFHGSCHKHIHTQNKQQLN